MKLIYIEYEGQSKKQCAQGIEVHGKEEGKNRQANVAIQRYYAFFTRTR